MTNPTRAQMQAELLALLAKKHELHEASLQLDPRIHWLRGALSVTPAPTPAPAKPEAQAPGA